MSADSLRRLVAALTSAVACACALAAPAFAMTDGSRPLAPDASRGIAARVVWSRDVRDAGPLARDVPVHVAVLMKYRHESELHQLVRAQGDRRSPYYHRYLDNARWNAYFAVDPAGYARTLATLRRAGFRIEREFANRGTVGAVAPARVVERFFATRMHRVIDAGGVARYANVAPALLPHELSGDVVSVAGLHSFALAKVPAALAPGAPVAPLARSRAAGAAATASPTPRPVGTSTPAPNPQPEPTIPGGTHNFGNGPRGTAPFGPYTFANAYDYPVQHGYAGRGRALGNVAGGDFLDSDLAGFFNRWGYARTGAVHRVFVSGAFVTDRTGQAAAESTLDVEAMLGLAPAADYYEYLIPILTDDQILFAYERAVSDNVVDAVNSSFGACETDDPSGEYEADYVAMQGVAKGITFAAATGDNGSQSCGFVSSGSPAMNPTPTTQEPSSGYYFTAVGGTTLLTNTMTGAPMSETAWTLGGGGISRFEPEPDWQASTAGASTAGRNVPDLAIAADSSLSSLGIFLNGGLTGAGGTSLASPLFAAMQAEIDETQRARNGWINPRLYTIANAQPGFAFHDIVAGSNGRYQATPGYDNTTGNGTPLGWELAGAE